MKSFSIAYYNTENFYDTIDDPDVLDNEYTPEGSMRWTEKRYRNKVGKISSVIARLGFDETGHPPLFCGLSEIENSRVLKDLVESENLGKYDYGFVHFDSKDERGIDNALIFRKNLLHFKGAEAIRQVFKEENGRIDFSRDGLYVKFMLKQNLIHIFIVHFPSRANENEKKNYRNQIMENLRERMDQILALNPEAQIILMGDMNSDPDDQDAMKILRTSRDKNPVNNQLYNPMFNFDKNTGSLKYMDQWILFDQILFSKSFLSPMKNQFSFSSAHIYNDKSIRDWDKNFEGAPFRTYAGTKYLGGYSDHFPIYSIINS